MVRGELVKKPCIFSNSVLFVRVERCKAFGWLSIDRLRVIRSPSLSRRKRRSSFCFHTSQTRIVNVVRGKVSTKKSHEEAGRERNGDCEEVKKDMLKKAAMKVPGRKNSVTSAIVRIDIASRKLYVAISAMVVLF